MRIHFTLSLVNITGRFTPEFFNVVPPTAQSTNVCGAGSHLPRDLLDRRISPKRPNVKWGQPGSTVRLCDLDSQRSKAEHIHVEANVTFSTEFTLHLRPGKINVRLGTSGGRNMVKLSLNPRHVVYSDTQTHWITGCLSLPHCRHCLYMLDLVFSSTTCTRLKAVHRALLRMAARHGRYPQKRNPDLYTRLLHKSPTYTTDNVATLVYWE